MAPSWTEVPPFDHIVVEYRRVSDKCSVIRDFHTVFEQFKEFKEFIVSGCNKHHTGSTGSFITIRFVREGAVAPYSSKTELKNFDCDFK